MGMETGLSFAELQTQRRQFGFNEIREEPTGPFQGILKRLWGPIPWMLEAALILEIILGRTLEPVIIAVWLLFSAILGGIQERRALRTRFGPVRSKSIRQR